MLWEDAEEGDMGMKDFGKAARPLIIAIAMEAQEEGSPRQAFLRDIVEAGKASLTRCGFCVITKGVQQESNHSKQKKSGEDAPRLIISHGFAPGDKDMPVIAYIAAHPAAKKFVGYLAEDMERFLKISADTIEEIFDGEEAPAKATVYWAQSQEDSSLPGEYIKNAGDMQALAVCRFFGIPYIACAQHW